MYMYTSLVIRTDRLPWGSWHQWGCPQQTAALLYTSHVLCTDVQVHTNQPHHQWIPSLSRDGWCFGFSVSEAKENWRTSSMNGSCTISRYCRERGTKKGTILSKWGPQKSWSLLPRNADGSRVTPLYTFIHMYMIVHFWWVILVSDQHSCHTAAP